MYAFYLAKMKWLQDPNESNVGNLNSVRRQASKINELETDSKKKNIRELYMGISDFKKDYQP
jgi:hypothetical protein